MSAFEKALSRLDAVEGGYVNDPMDSGKATRFGITEALAREYGYQGDMRDFPRESAEGIYKRHFWNYHHLSQVADLSFPIADEVFEAGVNVGRKVGGKWLQRILNGLNDGATLYPDISVDGQVGPETLGALRAYLVYRGWRGEVVLFCALNAMQAHHYVTLAERRARDERFLYGWLWNRVAVGIFDIVNHRLKG